MGWLALSRARGGAALLAAVAVAGCAAVGDPSADERPAADEGSRPLFDPTAAKILFPLNVVPDIASNFLSYATLPVRVCFIDDPGNIWPMAFFFSPIFGIVTGIADAWHGYPFWDPVAFDEHRRY